MMKEPETDIRTNNTSDMKSEEKKNQIPDCSQCCLIKDSPPGYVVGQNAAEEVGKKGWVVWQRSEAAQGA